MNTLVTPPDAMSRLLSVVKGELKGSSQALYAYNLDLFAEWLKVPGQEEACQTLVSAGPFAGHSMVSAYLDDMKARGLSPATMAHRLATIKRVLRCARILGLCHWTIELRPPKPQAFRDTRGPGPDRVSMLIRGAASQKNPVKASRDVGILSLLYCQGLRRGEVCSLRYADLELDPQFPVLWTMGKGKVQREMIPLGEETMLALAAWLRYRGTAPGPLFHRLDPGLDEGQLRPLDGSTLWGLVADLARGFGFKAWPHGLRHAAITEVIEQTHDLLEAQKFGRHASANTTTVYYDNMKRVSPKAPNLLGSGLKARLA